MILYELIPLIICCSNIKIILALLSPFTSLFSVRCTEHSRTKGLQVRKMERPASQPASQPTTRQINHSGTQQNTRNSTVHHSLHPLNLSSIPPPIRPAIQFARQQTSQSIQLAIQLFSQPFLQPATQTTSQPDIQTERGGEWFPPPPLCALITPLRAATTSAKMITSVRQDHRCTHYQITASAPAGKERLGRW